MKLLQWLEVVEKDFEIIMINLVNGEEENKEILLKYFKSQDWTLRTQCIDLTADFKQDWGCKLWSRIIWNTDIDEQSTPKNIIHRKTHRTQWICPRNVFLESPEEMEGENKTSVIIENIKIMILEPQMVQDN